MKDQAARAEVDLEDATGKIQVTAATNGEARDRQTATPDMVTAVSISATVVMVVKEAAEVITIAAIQVTVIAISAIMVLHPARAILPADMVEAGTSKAPTAVVAAETAAAAGTRADKVHGEAVEASREGTGAEVTAIAEAVPETEGVVTVHKVAGEVTVAPFN